MVVSSIAIDLDTQTFECRFNYKSVRFTEFVAQKITIHIRPCLLNIIIMIRGDKN